MKLKSRLIIAFFIMIMVPMMLISISAKTITGYQMRSISQSYDVETNTIEVITNPIQILNRLTRGVYNEIKLAALKYPQKLEDIDFINELNNTLENKYSFIVLRVDGKYIYTGDQGKLNTIASSLPKFGVYNSNVDGGIYMGGKNPYLIKMQDFYTQDNKEASIFVLTYLTTIVPQIRHLAIQLIISYVFILILMAFVLIYWIYFSMLKPLTMLRYATNQIKNGNLEYQVKSSSKDEIGQLCEDFDEMRIKLQELIEGKLANEEYTKELISNISHDLKTPLTAIKGYSEGIMDGVADTKEKTEKYLKTIYTKANEMQVLVDELSLYSKIDCNALPYSFKDIRLYDYFEDCIDEIRFELEVQHVEIIYNNKVDHSVKVVADAEQLKRVINNIIGNSVKYLDKENGIIEIEINNLGKMVEVHITDNGKGIKASDIDHIFDRFYRADTSRNSKKGGSGLGLAIAKKIINDHDGGIWAKSREGEGTRITFTLIKSEEKEIREDEKHE